MALRHRPLRNYGFDVKAYGLHLKTDEVNECYEHGSFSEISVASDWRNQGWTQQSIYERTDKLLTFIGERWNVPHWADAKQRILKSIEPAPAKPINQQSEAPTSEDAKHAGGPASTPAKGVVPRLDPWNNPTKRNER
jgi:hypothetical protein